MDKRHPSVQLMDTRYHMFINAAQTFKDKPQKSKDIAILLKECNMPCSSAYSTHYQRVGIIIKKGNLFMLNPELSRKEFEDKYALMNRSFRKTSGTKEDKSSDIPQNLRKINDEEKEKIYIDFLKSTGKYKIMKLERVQVVSYKDEWQEV